MKKNSLHYCSCGEKKFIYGKKKLCPICDQQELKIMARDALRRNKKVIDGMIKVRR